MKTILISEGDPTSINYELVDKSLSAFKRISKTHRVLFLRGNHNLVPKGFRPSQDLPQSPGLYSLTHSFLFEQFQVGHPSVGSGKMAYRSLLFAMEMQQKTKGDLITLPLSKEWVKRGGISNFRGHTEALAEFYQTETFMMMTGPKWKVIPLTTHIPLKNVAKELSKFPWHSLSLALRKSKFSKKANLGVLGLNPHAGEGGKIGREEFTILSQGMEILKKDGWKIEGPIPADSAFLPGSKKYEILLACYHDQGLIPFKLLEGKKGVNLTLGLDFLRVSPDHGTAFDIAGKGLASPEGLLSCLSLLSEKI